METFKMTYEAPALNRIELDTQISLVLQTNAAPPAGPNESNEPDVNRWGENTFE